MVATATRWNKVWSIHDVCVTVLGRPVDGEDDMMSLRQQVTTLAQALNTLTIEKSKMESSFQQDKRGLLVGDNMSE